MEQYQEMLDTLSDLFGKAERRARKPWIMHEMISKVDERRKRKNVNNEEGRKNCRPLRNELKRVTEKAKKKCLESTYDEIMEFQRTGRYRFMYMKKMNWAGKKMGNSKHWLSREYNNRSEKSTENLGELCYRALRSS